MTEHESYSEVLRYYAERRFGTTVTGGTLAKAGNDHFDLEEAVGLKRQTLHNWLNGKASNPNDWWQVGALTRIVCETPAEADRLLQAAEHKTIAQKKAERERRAAIEDAVREKVESAVVSYWSQWVEPSGAITREEEKNTHDRKRAWQPLLTSRAGRWTLGGVTVLALLGLLFMFWPFASTEEALPFIVDDFSDEARCKTIWDFNLSRYATCDGQAGHLRFQLPLNTTDQWVEDLVDATLTGESSIRRLRFTAALMASTSSSLGVLGVQTPCHGDEGWLVIYLGGARQQFFAQYSSPQEPESDPIAFAPIALGQEYTVELNWLGDGVHVALDGQEQEPAIPCSQPRLFNMNAGVTSGAQVDGYITDIRAWD